MTQILNPVKGKGNKLIGGMIVGMGYNKDEATIDVTDAVAFILFTKFVTSVALV